MELTIIVNSLFVIMHDTDILTRIQWNRYLAHVNGLLQGSVGSGIWFRFARDTPRLALKLLFRRLVKYDAKRCELILVKHQTRIACDRGRVFSDWCDLSDGRWDRPSITPQGGSGCTGANSSTTDNKGSRLALTLISTKLQSY